MWEGVFFTLNANLFSMNLRCPVLIDNELIRLVPQILCTELMLS